MHANEPAVSIVVPIYNVEAWLADCCDSLIAQTWQDWEAILLVDGSPDDSISIARRYEAQDARFRVKEIENRGLGGARNAAVEIARGEYVFFLDSDDVLTPRALEMLMSAAERTDADIAAGYGEDLFDGGIRKRYWTYNAAQFLRRPSTYTLDEMPSLTDDHTAWGKLIRRRLIDREQLEFPAGVHCEDIVFSLKSQLAANRITVVTEPVYLHRRHGAAISADYLRVKTLGDWISEAAKTLDVIRESKSATVRNHYVLNHTLKQWLTRALRFTEIPTPELLQGVEQLAAKMLETADEAAVEALDSWSWSLLHAFAAGIPSTRWSSLRANPLARFGTEGVEEVDFAHAVLTAAAALEAADAIEGRIATSLLLSRLVVPAASGYPVPDSMLPNARALLSQLPAEALAAVDRAAIAEPGLRRPATMATAWELLSELHTAAGTIDHVSASRTTVTVSGALERVGSSCFKDRFSVVFVSDAGVVTTVPTAVQRDGKTLRWQVAVPHSVLGAGRQRMLLRRSSRYAPGAVDYRLTVAEGAIDGDAAQPISSDPAVLAFAEPTGDAISGKRVSGRVFTFPNWYSNPYLTMLHTEVVGGGMQAPGTVDPNRALAELHDRRARGVIHIHWTSPLIEKHDSRQEAEGFVDEFLSALAAARTRGRAVIWTVHNALPHDSKFPETAIRLHAELAQVADIIHVLSTSTVDAVDGVYELPADKVRVLEHSSYQGVYGDRMPRDEARATIGTISDSPAVLFFGQLRPYKGLDQLFDAAIELQTTGAPIELLLAGKPAPELAGELERIEASGVDITSALRFIDDAEVAAWFSAADVAVLPYRKVLNSGSMMLAATYGLPVILPDEPALVADFCGQPWIRFFDTSRSADSIAELLHERWYDDEQVRQAALDFARRRSPVAMSRGYLRLLREAESSV